MGELHEYWPGPIYSILSMVKNKHTRVEPVGRVAKMNWLNYDMSMKIHAICDAKNAILKYFSLDMWKFAQIWAFFFLYGEF